MIDHRKSQTKTIEQNQTKLNHDNHAIVSRKRSS
jgi:hypothetical protein